MYQINEISQLAGVSVRTLHHYDKIGLLVPDKQISNGYRIYTQDHVKRLQDIIFFKTLGFKLSEIGEMLTLDGYDRLFILNKHKSAIELRMNHLKKVLEAIDKTIDDEKGDYKMSDKERFESFDMDAIDKHREAYKEETEAKYGGTDAYKQSQKKTKGYKKEDWKRVTEESNTIYKAFYELKNMGVPASDEKATELVVAWQDYITRNFYDCSKEILSGLADMYVMDQRFKDNIDANGEGIAQYMHDSIKYFCSK